MANIARSLGVVESSESASKDLQFAARYLNLGIDGRVLRSQVKSHSWGLPNPPSTPVAVLPASSKHQTKPAASLLIPSKQRRELPVHKPGSLPSRQGNGKAKRDRGRMSSQRSRQPRSGARGGTHEAGEEAQIWGQIHPHILKLGKGEAKAKDLAEQIFHMESQMKAKEVATGKKASTQDYESLDRLYREQVSIAESQKAILAEHKKDLAEKIGVLIGMVRHNEEAAEAPPIGRTSTSRSSAMEFDGPSDSPLPSPADTRQVRKIGNGRTSSQPPRQDTTRGDATPSEAVERPANKPKIVFSKDEEVAFKRKIPGKTEEQDWIQGIVTRVIGEGKSRRYDVQDPFPDDASVRETTYKSSASQMVPIPPVGSTLGDYEIGKRVLALYPDTTTFYRAEVKAMLDDGANVQLLFEDEAAGALKIVERRMVLDHKG